MSSTFLKTSPYSSSYGLYGAGSVNPYVSLSLNQSFNKTGFYLFNKKNN